MKRLIPHCNLLLVLGASLIYLATFRLLYGQVGENIVALSMVPMLIAGWYFGWIGGLLTTQPQEVSYAHYSHRGR